MQEALPFKPWTPPSILHPSPKSTIHHNHTTSIKSMVSDNAVIVIGRRGCCMSHVVKRLLHGLGVNPAVHEVDEDDEAAVIRELDTIGGDGDGGHDKQRPQLQFPAVFIGGRLFGGLDRIMATHITGELTPILKQAGALWL